MALNRGVFEGMKKVPIGDEVPHRAEGGNGTLPETSLWSI